MMWSWVLAVVGIAGLWLAGSGRPAGWMIGVGAHVLLIAYAVATDQYGFIVTAVAYAFVYARGAIRQLAEVQRRATNWLSIRGHRSAMIRSGRMA